GELSVQLGEHVRVEVLEQVLHPRIDRLGAIERLGAEQGSGQRRRGSLDEAQRLHGMRVLALVDQRDPRADVGFEAHQAFGLEPADRLSHGDDAHVEAVPDHAENQAVARSEDVRRDARTDPVVRLLRLAALLGGGHRTSDPADAASYRERHSAFIGNRPSTGCPSATRSAIQASSASCASASSATSSATDAGITITPSPSPTMMSPGCTVAPPHEIVMSESHGTWRRPSTAGCAPCEKTGRPISATASKSRTPPSLTTPAAPRVFARRARMSPSVPVSRTPRASITMTSPSRTAAKTCFWALNPPPCVLKRSSRKGTKRSVRAGPTIFVPGMFAETPSMKHETMPRLRNWLDRPAVGAASSFARSSALSAVSPWVPEPASPWVPEPASPWGPEPVEGPSPAASRDPQASSRCRSSTARIEPSSGSKGTSPCTTVVRRRPELGAPAASGASTSISTTSPG